MSIYKGSLQTLHELKPQKYIFLLIDTDDVYI